MEDTIIKLRQLDTLLYAIEGAIMEVGETTPAQKRMNDLFYILWDQIRLITQEAESDTEGEA